VDNDRIFYIYVVSYPDGSPCYVGKGSTVRWKRSARKSHNPLVRAEIRKNGGSLPVKKIRENLTEQEAWNFEIELIASIGRRANGGPLLNVLSGGAGPPSGPQSLETRKKRSIALLGKPKSLKHRLAMRVPHRPLTQQERDDISRRQTGKFHDEIWKANIGKGIRESPKNEARKKAIGDAHRGISRGPCTEARREAQRKSILATFARRRAAAVAAAFIGDSL
jgi:hypothetical protein